MRDEQVDLLDQFSISQTTALQERMASSSPCTYNAPYFAYKAEGKIWNVVQGNCHHWDCPRCGLGRAKQEYGRMVQGCRDLGRKYPLYFITITCKGRELSHEEADKQYLTWTNRLLTACRTRAKRKGCQWHYVQVTERQKRQHPHSHFITTFCPPITEVVNLRGEKITESGQPEQFVSKSLRSDWFADAVCSSGLGEQYNITKVSEAEAASRYVAKYLFKPSIFTADWPPKWKRIRYSQSFPKLPKRKTEAIVLIKWSDWVDLSERAVVVNCPNIDTYEDVSRKMTGSDCIIRLKTEK